MKVKELLADVSKWTQGAFARDVHRLNTPVSTGVCFCLLGALERCYGLNDRQQNLKVYELLPDEFKKGSDFIRSSIATYNDHPTTRFEDVMKIVEKADI